jgi:hypothetical protein
MPVDAANGVRVSLADVSPGDAIVAGALPWPEHALYYNGRLVVDQALEAIHARWAKVTWVSRDRMVYHLIPQGLGSVTVVLHPGKKAAVSGEALLSKANLRAGSKVRMNAVINTRLSSVREISALQVMRR